MVVYNERSIQGLMNGYKAYGKLVQRIKYVNYILLLMIPSLLSLFIPSNWTISLLMGLGLGILNYHLLSKNLGSIVLSVFANSGKGNFQNGWVEHNISLLQKGFVLKYYFRIALIATILYFVIKNSWVNPLLLLAGITLILVNILLTSLYSTFEGERKRINALH